VWGLFHISIAQNISELFKLNIWNPGLMAKGIRCFFIDCLESRGNKIKVHLPRYSMGLLFRTDCYCPCCSPKQSASHKIPTMKQMEDSLTLNFFRFFSNERGMGVLQCLFTSLSLSACVLYQKKRVKEISKEK